MKPQICLHCTASRAEAEAAGQARVLEEAAARKQLHNDMVDAKGMVRVLARVRPCAEGDAAAAISCHTASHMVEAAPPA